MIPRATAECRELIMLSLLSANLITAWRVSMYAAPCAAKRVACAYVRMLVFVFEHCAVLSTARQSRP